jgi:hypothetical protein
MTGNELSANCADEQRILNDPNYQQDRVKHATELHKGCATTPCACFYHTSDGLGDPIPVDKFWELIRKHPEVTKG